MEQFFDTFGELNNEAKKTERIVKSFWEEKKKTWTVCGDINSACKSEGQKAQDWLVFKL